jgi:hypothetical protein
MLVLMLLAAEPAWKSEGGRDGVTLESRPVEGSAYFEYRARGAAGAEVGELCDGVFEWASLGTDHPQLKARTLLEDMGDSRVIHDQLDPPMVAHRELTFIITRHHDKDGSCSIEYRAANDRAPKAAAGWVRIEKLRGEWHFVPDHGKTRVTYTLFAEPGGSVWPVLVHGPQREAVIDTLRKGLTKAQRSGHSSREPAGAAR